MIVLCKRCLQGQQFVLGVLLVHQLQALGHLVLLSHLGYLCCLCYPEGIGGTTWHIANHTHTHTYIQAYTEYMHI